MAQSILELVLNTIKKGTGAKEAKKELDGVTSSIKSLAAGAGLALGAGGAVFMLGKFLKDSVAQAAEAQKAHAQLEAVIRSTGGAAGVTAREVEDLATSLARMTAYDDEAIVSAGSLLLTFKQIGSSVLPEATQAILDMSTAMGTDLKSSAIMIGKALNDPRIGLTALQRAGVTFTKGQRDLIQSFLDAGDAAGAQAVILRELNSEFGGSAAAALDTYSGKLKQLSNDFGNLQEHLGSALIPTLQDVVAWVDYDAQAWDMLGGVNLRRYGEFVKIREELIRQAEAMEHLNAVHAAFRVRDQLTAEGMRDMAEAVATTTQTLVEAMAAGKGAFVPIDFSLPDPAAEFTKIQDYLNSVASGEAAGGKLTAMIDLALQQGQLAPETAADIQKQIGVTSADLAFKAGEIDAGELQTQLTEIYGMPADAAKVHVKDVMSTTADELKDQLDTLGVHLATTLQSVNPVLKKAMQPIFDAAAAYKGITDKEITITVTWENEGAPGGQHGLDMMVPQQVKGDTFPVFATGGERVIIQTQAQQAAGVTVAGPAPGAGGGAGVSIGNINVNNGTDERALLAMIRRLSS